jgi:hypothetical protein
MNNIAKMIYLTTVKEAAIFNIKLKNQKIQFLMT